MNSPRTATALLAAAVAGVALAGCNTLETTTPAALAPEPRVGERFAGTTRPVRDWSPTVANYQNGDTVSDSTGIRYISDVGQLFGRGGRHTRSDVVAAGGEGGYTTAIASAGGTTGGGPSGVSGTSTIPGAGAGATGGTAGGTGVTVGGTELAAGAGAASNVQSAGTTAGNAQTPAVASGSTVNGNIVRADGSIVPVGSPGAAGSTASIAAAPGSVGQTVAPQDVGAIDGNAVSTAETTGGGAESAGTPGAALSTREVIAAGAATPFVETGVFFANLVTAPVTLIQQRDGITSTGFQFRPTSTAMPAMPPEPGRVPPRRSSAPVGIVAPQQPLSPLPGVLPATRPAAERAAMNVKSVLPPVVPVSPSTTMPTSVPAPSTMPTAMPAPKPMASSLAASPSSSSIKPGTLTRSPDVSTTAFAVAGDVPYAGRYEVRPNLTLDDALRGAGVLPADPSRVMIRLQRRGSSVSTPVTLASLRARTGADALVQPGDILTVTTSR